MNFISILFLAIAVLAGITALVFFKKSTNVRKELKRISTDKSNLENIIHQANDALLVIDIVDGRIYTANPKLSELLGYPHEKLLKLSVFDLHPKEMLNRSSEVIADVWEKKGLIYTDVPFITSSGEILPVECSAKVIPYRGRPAILIYARDIRERLRMEKEIRDKNAVIEEKNKNITDSIRYAKRIQDSFLPTKAFMDEILLNYFVLFIPKDIVSGDFFWVNKTDSKIFFSAIDCTGHGVPGAFVSIIAYVKLQQALIIHKLYTPSEMLDKLNEGVTEFFSQQGTSIEIKDGMDIALCALDRKKMLLEYSGANNPIYIVRNKELIEIHADKQPIGEYLFRKKFTNKEIAVMQGDTIYLFSDGYADQFGGPKGKKFKHRQLRDVLLSVRDKSMDGQKEFLLNALSEWKGELEQVDDILVLGIRI